MGLPADLDFNADRSASPERMSRAMSNIDGRLKSLEAYKPNLDQLWAQLVQLGSDRINNALAPVYVQLLSIQALGFLNAPIVAGTTADFEPGNQTVTISADRRGFFTPSPWVAFVRGANATDMVVGRVQSYDQTTGLLVVKITNTFGNTGSYSDVTVWGMAGGALSALDSAAHVAADRTAVAADRAAAEQAAADAHAAQILINGGPVSTFNGRGGNVALTVADIEALIPSLPTSPPATAGKLYIDGGVISVS